MLTKEKLKSFKDEIISFLKNQLHFEGDISKILNKYAENNTEHLKTIRTELYNLTAKRILYIRYYDTPNPIQGPVNWWGNLKNVDFTKGETIEGVYARLTDEYINKHKERIKTLKNDLAKGAVTAVFSVLVGMLLWNLQNKGKNEVDAKQNSDISNLRDSLTTIYRKDSLLLHSNAKKSQ